MLLVLKVFYNANYAGYQKGSWIFKIWICWLISIKIWDNRPRLSPVKLNFKVMKLLIGPVHTNPFSNENGAVLLRFQKGLRPHLSFSYRFRPSTLQRRICLETLLYPQCAWSNEIHACAFWILTVEWFGAGSCQKNRGTVWDLTNQKAGFCTTWPGRVRILFWRSGTEFGF